MTLARRLPSALLCVLVGVGLARADEARLVDGEILHGTIERRDEQVVIVRQRTAKRTLPTRTVAAVVAGPDPYLRLAQASETSHDAAGHAALAWLAWRSGLDTEMQRVGAWAVQQGTEDTRLRVLLGASAEGGPYWRTTSHALPRWGEARRRALAHGRGTAATEAAVRAALDWLAAHQDEDGKLDADDFMKHDPPDAQTDGAGGGHHGERRPCGFDGATTAVALMAWLAGGSTPVSGPHSEPVAKALAWCRARMAGGPGGAYGLWNHGFCTQAVADAALVVRDVDLLIALETSVRQILALQREDGGWSYYLPIGDVPTTAVAACALAQAARAGVGVPTSAVAAALRFLDARIDRASGRSEYHDGAERKGYTPTRANTSAALAVRAWLGTLAQAPHRSVQLGALRDKPVWKIEFKEVKTRDGRKVRAQIGNLYPYHWYYTTLALFERGGSAWSGWFGGLQSALLAGQRDDGSYAGSWDPLGTYSTSAGRVFVTGLCALMLQTPYRYARRR